MLCKVTTVQDTFQPIPGLISCTGMTQRWGRISHALNIGVGSKLRVGGAIVYSKRVHSVHQNLRSCSLTHPPKACMQCTSARSINTMYNQPYAQNTNSASTNSASTNQVSFVQKLQDSTIINRSVNNA